MVPGRWGFVGRIGEVPESALQAVAARDDALPVAGDAGLGDWTRSSARWRSPVSR
jgi:hypothetical protein